MNAATKREMQAELQKAWLAGFKAGRGIAVRELIRRERALCAEIIARTVRP